MMGWKKRNREWGSELKGPQDEGWLTARNQTKARRIWLGIAGFGLAGFKQKEGRVGPIVRSWGGVGRSLVPQHPQEFLSS